MLEEGVPNDIEVFSPSTSESSHRDALHCTTDHRHLPDSTTALGTKLVRANTGGPREMLIGQTRGERRGSALQ